MPEINLGNVNEQQEEIELNNFRVANEVSTLDGVRIIEEKTEECVERLEDILDDVDGELAKKADKATTYTKTEVDTSLALKADKATTYTKTEVDSLVQSVFRYKGTKATVAEVEALTQKAVGDMWFVTADSSEYAWNGTKWEKLGPIIDLTPYLLNISIAGLTINAQSTTITKDQLLTALGVYTKTEIDTMKEEVDQTIANIIEKVNVISGIVYGFHISASEGDPSAKVTYLADAKGMTPAYMDYETGHFSWGSWRDAFFLPKPCMLKSDGTVDYYLNENDYSLKEDGTPSDVANTAYDGNAMMEWGRNGKKIWYCIVPDETPTGASIYIADYQVNDNYKAYSFINKDNQLVDHFYTPCYFGSIIDGKLRSLSGISGESRCKKMTATAERTAAKLNNPTGVDIWDFECYADNQLITFLLWLMGKSTNVQAVFGQGLHTSGSDAVNDAFVSGQHDNKGLFYGTNSGAAATYTNAVKVFGMENFWGFMWRRELGYVNVTGTLKYKMTAGTADGSTAEDYVVSNTGSDYDGYKTGEALPSASGTYIDEMTFNEDAMTPTAAGGTATTHFCDGLWTNLTSVCFSYRGGDSHNGLRCGAVCRYLGNAASGAGWYIGASPSCKPLLQEG